MNHAQELDWSRQHFASIRDGGTWAVPRSGLLFRRSGPELHLFARMPHVPEMPISAEGLRKQQDADYAIIASRFTEAGIVVKDCTWKS